MENKRRIPKAVSARGTQAAIARLLAEERESVGTVLDIPCGAGALAPYLQDLGMQVHGADIREYLEAEGVAFTRADMNEGLPFPDGRFDAVVCGDGIEHTHRQNDFVRECRRILRRGGILVVSTPNISALRSRFRWLVTGFHNKGKTPLDETRPDPRHHVRLLAFHELRYLLCTNGFRITEIACNRVKAVSWLYLPLVPCSYVMTRLAFRREEERREEKDPTGRRRNREILSQMFTKPVLFGETLIVKCVCEKA